MSKQKALKNFSLAKPVELNLEKGFPKNLKYVIKEEKLDGFRGFAIVRNGRPKLYTSGGVRVVNGPRIVLALALIAKIKLKKSTPINFTDRCYDGEFFVKNWNDTGSIVKTLTPNHPKRKELCFRIFDTISLEEWKTRKGIDKLKRRKVNLQLFQMVSAHIEKKYANAVPVIFGKMMQATITNAERFLKSCVRRKHEGAVFKNPESVYPFKKHRDYGYKLKPFKETDLEVIAHKMGKGKNSHHTGSMMCRGYFGKKLVNVQVGGGLTDAERDMFYKMFKKKKLIGTIIEMKHEGLTKKGSLRFPRFHRVRSKIDKPSLKQ